jgi:hypothetical protein
MYNDKLEHYGVKGMKWGIRKDRDGGGRVKKAAKKVGAKALDSAQRGVAKSVARKIHRESRPAMRAAIKDLNKKFGKVTGENEKKYAAAVEKTCNKILADATDKHYNSFESGSPYEAKVTHSYLWGMEVSVAPAKDRSNTRNYNSEWFQENKDRVPGN